MFVLACVHAYMHECIDSHMHACVHADSQAYPHTHMSNIYVCRHAYLDTYMHICIYASVVPRRVLSLFFQPAMPGIVGGMAMAHDHTVLSASLMDMVC